VCVHPCALSLPSSIICSHTQLFSYTVVCQMLYERVSNKAKVKTTYIYLITVI
jgi:hypothetical protein